MAMKKFKMLNLICESCTLTSKEKLVAQYFIYKSNKKGECYPSVGTIARHCGVSERTVQRATKKLQEKDYITIEKRCFKGRQSSNDYILNTNLIDGVEEKKEGVEVVDKVDNSMEAISMDELLFVGVCENELMEKENYDKDCVGEAVVIHEEFEYDKLDSNLVVFAFTQDTNEIFFNLYYENKYLLGIKTIMILRILLVNKAQAAMNNFEEIFVLERKCIFVGEDENYYKIQCRKVIGHLNINFFVLFLGVTWCHPNYTIIIY